jgi:hypothetical protein
MSKTNKSNLLELGTIASNPHYGPFASYWWYSKKDSTKLYPIRLHLKMHHIKNKIEFYTFIAKGKNNKPEYSCFVDDINEISDNMTAVVTRVYQKCLEKNKEYTNTKLDGPYFFGMGCEDHLKRISADITFHPFYIKENNFKMFVVDASHDTKEPLDGYHVTFIEQYKRESTLFSQFYDKKKFHVILYSTRTGVKLEEYQNTDVNELWESTGLFNMFAGSQLFLLENIELKQKIDELTKFEVNVYQWNPTIFEKLHQTHMKHTNNKDITISVLNYLHNKKSTLFELSNLLCRFNIIEKNHTNLEKLEESILKKIRAWRRLLNASGCKKIKTDKNNEYWSKAEDTTADLETLQLFSEINLKSESEPESNKGLDSDLQVKTFWSCFEDSMNNNIRGCDNQQRILSIIARDFTYSKLKEQLKISNDLITAARIYSRLYGRGAQILEEDRVKIKKVKFSDGQLKDLETFLSDKNNVTMSSYKTDPKSGKPVYYLKSTKSNMWEKYHEEYPNGLKRTSFMCRLDGQFKYREDLGGLCMTCDFYGYQVFDSIINSIRTSKLYEEDKKALINEIELLRRHIKRGLEEEIRVLNNGLLEHSSCLNHCLLYAFGECKNEHNNFCENCSSLFTILKKIEEFSIIEAKEIQEYEEKLMYYLSHQLRKIYLNSQFNATLREITHDGAVLICDYKMKVNPKSSRETKSDFYGKEGWTLHTIIAITKSDNDDDLNVRAFDHWSDDGKQDAWFTASAFDSVLQQLSTDNIKWIKIFSDNGGHYHNSELMVIASYWKKWYNIDVKKWQFLEAGEAKTIVDSHHAKLSHGFIRYTKLGNSISSGEDIVNANESLAGTSFAKITPDRSKKVSVGTIQGISNYFTFMWPTGDEEGFIVAYEIPNYGKPKTYSVSDIKKLLKNNNINQPNAIITNPTTPQSEWKICVPSEIDPSIQRLTVPELRSRLQEEGLDPTGNKLKAKKRLDQRIKLNPENNSLLLNNNMNLKNLLNEKLKLGFALKSNQKYGKKGGKKFDLNIIERLKSMFLAGNIEKSKKYSAEDMLKELQRLVENNELEADNILSLQQIKSWISRFSQHHKRQAAENASSN